jgi:undecaprenyl-diphosphatase
MTAFQAIVLGIVQGLAEFLPISSSAHLALTPWLFGWPAPGLAFDVSLHLGTLAAVLWFFRYEWRRLLAATAQIMTTRRAEGESERRVIYIAIATLPGALGGFLLNDYAETTFRAPVLISSMMILMGIVLWMVDRHSPQGRPLDRMRWHDALLIGIAQVLALIPGVSRSGATMTAGLALRFNRESAAVFSFLMSLPITTAAAVVKTPQALLEASSLAPLVFGILASALSGWFAIAVLLRYVSRHSFGIFAVYRVVVGGALLALALHRG